MFEDILQSKYGGKQRVKKSCDPKPKTLFCKAQVCRGQETVSLFQQQQQQQQ